MCIAAFFISVDQMLNIESDNQTHPGSNFNPVLLLLLLHHRLLRLNLFKFT